MADVLITGGAGFIGQRLTRKLLEAGRTVRILDSLISQVHGAAAEFPAWMRENCETFQADVCDRETLRRALRGVEAVVHLAAETGPAQSMYEMARYAQANVQGTAILLEEMMPMRDHLGALVVASSRAIYGEGKYRCASDGFVFPDARPDARLQAALWEPVCPFCGQEVESTATDEDSLPKPTSFYAVTKLTQEQTCLVWGRAYGVTTSALRYQNVYGPGQSLTNPYIGVLAIFAARIKSGSPIHVYEDGRESRDFVHVGDAVQATVRALNRTSGGTVVLNVGSGEAASLVKVASSLAKALGRDVPITVNGQYRVGDIRHCHADLQRSRNVLGYWPEFSLEAGLRDLAEWSEAETTYSSDLEAATEELIKNGLFRQATRSAT